MSLPSLFINHKTLGKKRRPHLISNRALIHYLSFLVIFFITTSITRTKAPDVLGYATNITIDELLVQTNKERLKLGAGEVVLDSTLSRAAKAKAQDMFEDNYWAHTSPTGTEPWDFILAEGYDYIFAGENLARDFATSKGVVKAWMESPSHRDNLLNPKYVEMGLAVVDGELDGYPTTLVVQMFGTPRRSIADISGASVINDVPGFEPKVEVFEATTESEPLIHMVVKEDAVQESEVTPVIDIKNATKNLSLYFIILFIALFVIDELYVLIRREGSHGRHLGHSEIHVLFMLFLLIVTIFVRSGGIL